MHVLEEFKRWVAEFTEILLLLIALAIAGEILFGSIPFFPNVVGNLTGLLSKLGDNGFVGLVAVGIIVWLFRRRPVPQG
ncbi:MAG: hypothetical protein ACYTEL_21635 [Planctomycetota bacterium]|jgi:hypothetical protein